MADYETVTYDVADGVATVTLNRPDRLNAFNVTMQRELQAVWRSARGDDDVRCLILTGAGDRAFCTGIDRDETFGEGERVVGSIGSPLQFDDPAAHISPKANDLWKPVVAAINGIACGGAYYMLGEVDIIIAADTATFFDPHVTYGMAASFESMHILQRLPLGEALRMQLLGAHERMSAQRALQVGLVSEVVPLDDLAEAAMRVARIIADSPPLAVQATLRATWAANELPRSQALAMGYAFIGLGSSPESLAAGQRRFSSGERVEWRLR